MRRTTTRWLAPLAVLAGGLAVIAGACTSLDDIERGVCGNSVLDPGEDCDSHAHPDSGTACGSVGTVEACRYTCPFPPSDEQPDACPEGYLCGAAGTCSRAGDDLVRAGDLELGGDALAIRDFDADGIADVAVTSEARRELTVLFLGAGTVVERTVVTPVESSALAVGDIDADPYSDVLVASNAAVSSLSSTANRELIGRAFFTYTGEFGEVPGRLIGLPAAAAADSALETGSAPLAPSVRLEGVFFALEDNPTVLASLNYVDPYGADSGELGSGTPFVLLLNDEQAVPADALVSLQLAPLYPPYEVTPGSFAEPCPEALIVRSDTREAYVVRLCVDGQPTNWCQDDNCLVRVSLGADTPIAAFASQLDGDIEEELIVFSGTAGEFPTGALVLEHDSLSGTLAVSGSPALDPTALLGAVELAASGEAPGPLLTMAHLNDDSWPDLVLASGVYLSKPGASSTQPAYYRAAAPSQRAWTEAALGDFNADARMDVTASQGESGLDIDVLLSGDADYMNPLVLPREGRVGLLRVGDFNGDGADDLLYRERFDEVDGECATADDLVVHFGDAPSTVLDAGRVVGRFPGVEDAVVGPLPRSLELVDSIDDFGISARCPSKDDSSASLSIAVFYGSGNGQVAAPLKLKDALEEGDVDRLLAFEAAKVSVARQAPLAVVAAGPVQVPELATDRRRLALFVLAPGEADAPLEEQHLILLGGDEHAGLSPTALHPAVGALAGNAATPQLADLSALVADAAHLHIIPNWSEFAPKSDDTDPALFDDIRTIPLDVEVVGALRARDLDGDDDDDVVVVGRADGRPFVRVFMDALGSDEAIEVELPFEDGGIVGLDFLPHFAEDGSYAGEDLALAVEGFGAVLLRWNGTTLIPQGDPLLFPQIRALAAGDLDGDQLPDLALLSGETLRVYRRSTRFAGDVATGAGSE